MLLDGRIRCEACRQSLSSTTDTKEGDKGNGTQGHKHGKGTRTKGQKGTRAKGKDTKGGDKGKEAQGKQGG